MTIRKSGGHLVFTALLCALATTFPALAQRYWVAPGQGDWNDANNWATVSGGGGGASVPSASDTVVFDGGGTGNCIMDGDVDVAGLRIEAGYTGAVIQDAGSTVTIGVAGYAQAGGTFSGGHADMTVIGSGGFTLSGGTFTAPAANLAIQGPGTASVTIFTITGGIFMHNSGTLTFNSYFNNIAARTHAIDLNGSAVTVNHLVYTGGNFNTGDIGRDVTYALGANETSNHTFIVEGDLLLDSGENGTLWANNGTLQVQGGVTIQGSGFRGGSTLIEMAGNNPAEYTYTAGKAPHLKINKTGDAAVSPAEGTSELHVEVFTLAAGVFRAPALLTIAGQAVDVTILTVSGGVFDHQFGAVKLSSFFRNIGNRIHAINLHDGSMELHDLIYAGGNTDSFPGRNVNYTLGEDDTLIVRNDLRLEPGAAGTVVANNGTIQVHGNMTIREGMTGGTTTVELIGDGDATADYEAGCAPHLKINKTGGARVAPAAETTDLAVESFTLAAGVFRAPGGTMSVRGRTANVTVFTYRGGIFKPNGGTLRFDSYFSNISSITHTIDLLGGSLVLNNLTYTGGNTSGVATRDYVLALGAGGTNHQFIVEGELLLDAYTQSNSWAKVRADNGTLQVRGDVTIRGGVVGNSTRMVFADAADQTVTHTGGTPPGYPWTIDKTGGTVNLSTDLALVGASRDLIWNGGDLNLSSNTLSIGRNVTIAAGAAALGVTVADAVTAGRLTADGAVTGLANAGLKVRINATAADVRDRTYTILINNTPLADEFASVKWPLYRESPTLNLYWTGKVDYSANDGKHVTLYGILPPRGSVLIMR